LKRIFALWRIVAGQDLRLLWFAIRHEKRPGWLLPGLAGLALFAVEPLVLHGMVKMLPAYVLDGFARAYPGRGRRRT
jgi:hypothetical protein